MAEQEPQSHRKTKQNQLPQLKSKSIGSDLKVVITGFSKSEQIMLQHYLKNLNLDVQTNLSFDGQLLISNTVLTNKYIAACFLNIPIVTQQWVYKTYKDGELQPYDQFQLGVFYKLKIGLLGFTEGEQEAVRERIIQLQGECLVNLNRQTKADVIMIKAGRESMYSSEISEIMKVNSENVPKIVNSEWFRQCQRRNYCVPTKNYEIVDKKWKQHVQNNYFKHLQEKEEFYKQLEDAQINSVLGTQTLNDSKYNYFSEVIAYIGIKEERFVKSIQRFILLADGIYLNELLPLVTHAIFFPNEIAANFADLYPQIKIVNPRWITDSFLYRTKIIEDDYLITTSSEQQSNFNTQDNDNELFEKNRDSFLLGEQQEHTGTFGQHQTTRQNSYGISTDQLFKNFQQPQSYRRALSFTQSNMFKDYAFYIFDHISLDKDLFRQIKNEGGIAHKYRFQFHQTLNFKQICQQNVIFLLPDSKETKKIIEQYQRFFKENNPDKKILYFLSYRSVNYFLDQKKVDLTYIHKFLYLLPANFETPSIQNNVIYVSVKNLDDKVLLRSLAKILTGLDDQKFDINKITHFITNKKNSKKRQQVEHINQNERKNNQIIVKDAQWLLDNFLIGP